MFIQSDFKGQLPGLYSLHSNSTSIIPDHMNDMNHEEPSRYVRTVCDSVWNVPSQKLSCINTVSYTHGIANLWKLERSVTWVYTRCV